MENLEIYEFKQAVIRLCNQSTLPIMVKKMIFDELANETGKLAEQEINKEATERQMMAEEKESEE